MDLQLNDKVVIISGGARGIGRATAEAFVREKAAVVIADRDEEAGRGLCRHLTEEGGRACLVVAELSRAEDCRNITEQALANFGRIDVLVNNAGFNDAIDLDQSPERFMESLNLNLLPAFALAHFCQSALKSSRGAIVNVGSKVAVTGQGGTSGYAAAKGGVNALTREWAAALAGHGVRVNAVLPAECLTDQYERWFQSLPEPSATRAAIERLIPLGRRMTTPREVADMIVFLASERSSHTTGQIVFVDGGYTHLDRALSHDHSKWG